jgi:hypothetical protein
MEMEYFGNSAVEIVLISIQDIKKIQQYYPNYFMDTTEFIKNINALFKSLKNERIQKMIDSTKHKKLAEIMSKNIFEKMLKFFDERKK